MIYNVYVSDQAIIIPNNKNPLRKDHFADCRIINPRLAKKHLMQCTWLKDINGGLVWEGDAILFKVEYKKEKDFLYGTVFFYEDEISAELMVGLKGVEKNKLTASTFYSLWEIAGEEIKVLGNIYENPKLLEAVTNE